MSLLPLSCQKITKCRFRFEDVLSIVKHTSLKQGETASMALYLVDKNIFQPIIKMKFIVCFKTYIKRKVSRILPGSSIVVKQCTLLQCTLQ